MNDLSGGVITPPQETYPPVEPVQPPDVYQAESAARLAYAERGSYGQVLARMFAEMEANPEMYNWTAEDDSYIEQAVAPPDVVAYKKFMTTVMAKLKESEAVMLLRRPDHQIESAHDIEAVFRAYERALEYAETKVQLAPHQATRLSHAAHSELDWSLRDLMVQSATLGPTAETRFIPKDFLLILNPKLRKIDYCDSQEILTILRRSGSLANKDRLKADLNILRHSQRPEAQVALEAYEPGEES